MQVLDKGYIKLLDHMGNDKGIVDSARLSYMIRKEPTKRKVRELLTTLITSGHTSPLEQVQFKFEVKCPIFIARQWMRHRTMSYNEQSRRYTKKNWEYYIPDASLLSGKKVSKEHIQARMNILYRLQMREYDDLISYGVAPQEARGIMGTGFYTTFVFSGNLSNILKLLEQRESVNAQPEFREYAYAMELLIEQIVPITIDVWRAWVIKKEEMKKHDNALDKG